MKSSFIPAATAAAAMALALALPCAQAQEAPIRIGVPTAIQLQVGRDTQDAVQMAIEEINARGGVLGRQLEMVVADETEKPEAGINAIKKLTAEEKVDVLIGGFTSGVTLAQLPHIARARTIYIGVGAASPAITQRVGKDYDNYKYIFRIGPINAAHQAAQLTSFISDFVIGELDIHDVAIVGENAKWVQDLVPILKKGAIDGGANVRFTELFETQSFDFSPMFSRIRNSGAQFIVVVLAHASSDVFAKQWHDAQVPIRYGGIDVKAMDHDFCSRLDGKAVSHIAGNFAIRAPLTPRTIPFFDAFHDRTSRSPVYTAFGAYDGVHVYAEAVERVGKLDTDAIIAELEKTSYEGVPGLIEFDDNHDVRSGGKHPNMLFAQWQPDCSREIVFPKHVRTADPILPPWMAEK